MPAMAQVSTVITPPTIKPDPLPAHTQTDAPISASANSRSPFTQSADAMNTILGGAMDLSNLNGSNTISSRQAAQLGVSPAEEFQAYMANLQNQSQEYLNYRQGGDRSSNQHGQAEDPVTIKGIFNNQSLENNFGLYGLGFQTMKENGNVPHRNQNNNPAQNMTGNTIPSNNNGSNSEAFNEGNAMFKHNAAALTKMMQQGLDSDTSGVSSSSDSATEGLAELLGKINLQPGQQQHHHNQQQQHQQQHQQQQQQQQQQHQYSQGNASQGNFQGYPSQASNPLPFTAMSHMDVLQAVQMQNDFLKRQQWCELLKSTEEKAQRNYKQNWSYNGHNNNYSRYSDNLDPIEQLAKEYRNAASNCDATCTWSGQLPRKVVKCPSYSCKVFLGGVPWDITEANLQNVFKSYGHVTIEWPRRDGKHPRCPDKAGYVYVLFDHEEAVKALLADCTNHDSGRNGSGEYYFKISSKKMKSKEVQVIPWVLGDTNHIHRKDATQKNLDSSKTVFVGALHGMLNAEGLAHILNDLFGGVVFAGIDTDKHKYPIGSGRVTFNNHRSYSKAVNAAFVEIKTPKFTKKIQIDPYLTDSTCGSCGIVNGPFFCRNQDCYRYYCRSCWQWAHSYDGCHHKPLMRNRATTG